MANLKQPYPRSGLVPHDTNAAYTLRIYGMEGGGGAGRDAVKNAALKRKAIRVG